MTLLDAAQALVGGALGGAFVEIVKFAIDVVVSRRHRRRLKTVGPRLRVLNDDVARRRSGGD